MAVDIFTREQFEKALPVDKSTGAPLWSYQGLDKGEHAYSIRVNEFTRIIIRSSVKADGQSAEAGKDSIRLILQINKPQFNGGGTEWRPLGRKLDAYTTRVAGWQGRMTDKVKELFTRGRKVKRSPGRCPVCGKARYCGITKSGKNAGRPFAACGCTKQHRDRRDIFIWLDVAKDSAGAAKRETPTAKRAADAPALSFISEKKAEIGDDVPACPLCGEAMKLRTQRKSGDRFWGCSTFPRCRGTRSYKVEVKKYKPSTYQEAIFDFVKNGEGHAVVEALAGSGKTTTNIWSLEYTDSESKVALVAFNRNVARDQAEKAPDHVRACTLHSLGLANVKAVWPDAEVEPKKLWKLLDVIYAKASSRRKKAFRTAIELNGSTILKVVSLCKATMREPTRQNIDWIADRFGIPLDENGDEKYIIIAVRALYHASIRNHDMIDYDDMIWFCASGSIPCEKFDFLIVDETQDLNRAQLDMALRSIKENGRIIATGDRFQSIYGFRGADAQAVPTIIAALNATTLPLNISYRCPKAVGSLVNEEFPGIPFEVAPNAREGVVANISYSRMISELQDGDLALCRTNAPLVKPAFALIKKGVKATIRGRDIGKGLVVLIEKVGKRAHATSLEDLLEALERYERKEVGKLIAAKKTGRAATLKDQVETIIALCDGVYTLDELKRRISSVFTEDRKGVVFSTVHRAKGDEANRVYIIKPELMPHPMAQQPWELEQEENIRYVAYTRAKRELYRVGGS